MVLSGIRLLNAGFRRALSAIVLGGALAVSAAAPGAFSQDTTQVPEARAIAEEAYL